MRLSRRAKTALNLLLEASASHAARHYSPKLQEAYEIVVFEAARGFVDQVRQDEAEAREGSRDDEDPLAFDPRDDNSPGVW